MDFRDELVLMVSDCTQTLGESIRYERRTDTSAQRDTGTGVRDRSFAAGVTITAIFGEVTTLNLGREHDIPRETVECEIPRDSLASAPKAEDRITRRVGTAQETTWIVEPAGVDLTAQDNTYRLRLARVGAPAAATVPESSPPPA